MKKLFLFVFAALAFAACEQAPIEEQSAILQDATKSITVSFEGDDDTRIQLNEAQKTVWTEGDHVSVFYRSSVNEEWQFMGKTGDRTGQIVPVDNSVNPPATHNRVVVIYPYNNEYYLNTETYSIEASLPAVQNYLRDSYGTNGNIMVSSNDYKQVSLKSVCGWLKLQLTGDGEVVKSITLRGNDGEQVTGELHINTSDATCVLASASGDAGDSEVGGTLVRPGTILTEVTLDCGEGVALGKEATAFYIALPPQTFEEGFTVDIECDGYIPMTLSTTNTLTIERNHIQPMASVEHNATPIVPNNQIWYTSSDGDVVEPNRTYVFGANIISNTYTDGMGVITFDGDITKIGDQAFDSCTSLTSVNIPDSVTTIGDFAFCSCDSLTEFNGKFAEDNGRILVVDGVLTAFAPAGITEYNIPDSVTTIGEYAFYSCTSLTSVNIPDSVTTIGDSAFCSCDSLTEFTGKFAEDNGRILVVDGVLTAFAPAGITEYNIPDSVTTIGSQAFRNCTSLTSVNIPDSVTTIGDSAFYNCSSLTSVNIPDSVTTIGDYAFDRCDSLTSVTIPDSVTAIGDYAFGWCESLTSVNIPDSVTTIGEWAFYKCTSLKSVNIPDSVTTIGDYAFSGCYSLTSVYCKATTPPVLGGLWVFDNNGSGRKIYVPVGSVNAYKSAKYWSGYAYAIVGYDFERDIIAGTQPHNEIWYTSSDGNVVTPNKTDAFGVNIVSNTYADGKGVIVFDGNLTSIGDHAFYYCRELTTVSIPNRVESIGYQAFDNCSYLVSVTIGNRVKTLDTCAFFYCERLVDVLIPDSVEKIGDYAFKYCKNLKSVTIGDSVKSIGEDAFRICLKLSSVYCKAITPPTLSGSLVFYDNASDRKIYVPAESVSAYKSANGWSECASSIVDYDF